MLPFLKFLFEEFGFPEYIGTVNCNPPRNQNFSKNLIDKRTQEYQNLGFKIKKKENGSLIGYWVENHDQSAYIKGFPALGTDQMSIVRD